MEVLSQLLDEAAMKKRIGYHPKCKALQITHLAFADDLLVFTDDKPASLNALKEVLHDFYILFGLRLNTEKT